MVHFFASLLPNGLETRYHIPQHIIPCLFQKITPNPVPHHVISRYHIPYLEREKFLWFNKKKIKHFFLNLKFLIPQYTACKKPYAHVAVNVKRRFLGASTTMLKILVTVRATCACGFLHAVH